MPNAVLRLLKRLLGGGPPRAVRRAEERSIFLHRERAYGIGHVADLSLTGIYVRSGLETAPGETIRATLPSEEGEFLEISGVVSRLAEGGFALRIEEASPGYAEFVARDRGDK